MSEKLNRSCLHIAHLEAAIGEYLAATPVHLSMKASEDGEWNVVFVEKIESLHPQIPCVLGDALYNLRSFLDHLMMQLVETHCDKSKIKIQNVYFPVKRSEKDFENWRRTDRIARELPDSILDAIAQSKPYEGGSYNIFALHKLNVIDKHRNLLLSAMNYQSANLASLFDQEAKDELSGQMLGDKSVGEHFMNMMSGTWIKDKTWNQPIFLGQEITRYKIDRTPGDPVVKFAISIFEEEIEVVPVIELLKNIKAEVTAIGAKLGNLL